MKILLSLFVSGLFLGNVFGQGFEGMIEFRKVKSEKFKSYIYYVKGDMVRLEEFGPNKTIVDLAVIDLKKETVFLLSPERKSYMNLNTNESSKDMSQTKVEQTRETKTILGFTCTKWVVSNAELDAKVTYWVTGNNYEFFVKLLSTLQRKDYHSLFFRQVPAAAGYFPLISILSDMNGVEKERMEAVSIRKQIIPSSTFVIPSDYTEIKN